MPGLADEKREWMKAALGVDIPASAGGGESRAKRAKDGDDEPAPQGEPQPTPTPTPPETGSQKTPPPPTTALDPEIVAALKALADEAAALKKLGFDTAQMMADHADLTKSATTASALPDADARKKALAPIK